MKRPDERKIEKRLAVNLGKGIFHIGAAFKNALLKAQ